MKVIDEKDILRILELQKLAFKKESIVYNDLQIPAMIQTKEEILEDFSNGTLFLKYEKNNEIVGSVRAYLDSKKICNIGRLVVNPFFQKQGIGKKLMIDIEKEFLDCKKFRLFTGEKNNIAFNLYKKLGYIESGRQYTGKYFLIYMEKINNIKINFLS
jgi:ribosomal protein S18 acetylase RimI-like enzyme